MEDLLKSRKQPKKCSSTRIADRCQQPNHCQEKRAHAQQLQQYEDSSAPVPGKRRHHGQQHQEDGESGTKIERAVCLAA